MERKTITPRTILIIGIIAICIISINVAVFLSITKKDDKVVEEIILDTVALSENFENIFDNVLDSQDYNSVNTINKINHEKEVVYTNYIKEEKIEGKYDINIKIPSININNKNIENINKEIQEIFYSKVNNIILQSNNIEAIYSVKYKAYINDNILSLIIMSNLKEGDNPQRVIIKTYNYNISSNEILNINQVLNYRMLNYRDVQNTINKVIKEASQTASAYQQLGYDKYLRDLEDDMYKIENTKVFFLGKGKSIYIIYPYGNANYTSEYDMIVI